MVARHGGVPDRHEHVRRGFVRSSWSPVQYGSVSAAWSPGGATTFPVGSGLLTFSDENNGTFAYTVNGISQTKNITRQILGAAAPPVCIFNSVVSAAAATNYQDIWWAAPAQSEDGWGINLTHQGSTIFGTWFTYDSDRAPMWLVVTALQTSSTIYAGDLYRTTGPPFNAVPFPPIGSPDGPTVTKVGTALKGGPVVR